MANGMTITTYVLASKSDFRLNIAYPLLNNVQFYAVRNLSFVCPTLKALAVVMHLSMIKKIVDTISVKKFLAKKSYKTLIWYTSFLCILIVRFSLQ